MRSEMDYITEADEVFVSNNPSNPLIVFKTQSKRTGDIVEVVVRSTLRNVYLIKGFVINQYENKDVIIDNKNTFGKELVQTRKLVCGQM